MTEELSQEALRAINLATKLMETRGCTEEEASSRVAKAMEMLARHNLDMAAIGTSAKGAQRADKTKKGGLYQWQRDLWKAAAEMNFCVYKSIKGLAAGSTYEHRVIGRAENVVVAELMANYLQDTTERHAKEYAREWGYNVFAREMIAYREGMATRLVERLKAKHDEAVREAKQQKAEEAMRAKHPGAASTGTSLVLVDVMQNEDDLNQDYLNGLEPGTTFANRKAREAAQAAFTAKQVAIKAEHEQRLLDDPAYAEAIRAKEAKRAADETLYWAGKKSDTYGPGYRPSRGGGGQRQRAETEAEKRAGLSTFRTGYRKGDDVGLDTQVKEERRTRI